MVDELKHLMTERILQLKQEAENLKPSHEIAFRVMRDPQMMLESAGGATHTDNAGNEIIYLDPNRATEHTAAHELMHIVLHRSGWPQMYSISLDEDKLARSIADTVDNILDQYIFDPRLEERGIQLASARDWYASQLEKWPHAEKSDPRHLLCDALVILEALLYRSHYRRRVIRAMKRYHVVTLALAQQIERLVDPQGARTKRAIRQSMIDILKHIDQWLSNQLGHPVNLSERIGISPIFTHKQLEQPASEIIAFESYPAVLEGRPLWIGALSMKSDHVRFRNVIALDATSEPFPISHTRQDSQIKNVRGFLESQNITKYSLDA